MDSTIPTEDNKNKENKKEDVVDALHNKSVLPSLRTYQGDIASFIKSKDQSVSEIALKNREVEENKKAEDKNKYLIDQSKVEKEEVNDKDRSGGTNALMVFLGGFLVIASILAVAYAIFSFYKRMPVSTPEAIAPIVNTQESIIINSENLKMSAISEALKTIKNDPKYKDGITSVDVSGITSNFIDKMNWSVPPQLVRSMEDKFTLGVYKNQGHKDSFIILKIKDYGIAFRDMLAWESTMFQELRPVLNVGNEDYSTYKFQDDIVKNKDARSLEGNSGNIVLIYTFLDQNTILITESESSLSAIQDAFINKNAIR